MEDEKQYMDSVYGQSTLDSLQRELSDTPTLLATKDIDHLGLAKNLFANAEHSRFSHNAGASILFSHYADALELGTHERLTGEAAAMLHDVGHMPFSHAAARYFKEKWNYAQEELAKEKIIRPGPVNDILINYDLNPDIIADLIFNKDFHKDYCGRYSYLKQLIAGDMDVDRLDFLSRDSKNTAPYGKAADWKRLIACVKRVDHPDLGDIIAYDEDAKPAVGAFFAGYFYMYQSVYYNPNIKAFEEMLDRALFLAHDILEETFKDFKEDPSMIGQKKIRETLLDLDPTEPNHHIAKELINAIFKENEPLMMATQLLNDYAPDMELYKTINEKFPYKKGQPGKDLLEKRLVKEIKGAKPGEIIVIRHPVNNNSKDLNVFLKLRETGLRKSQVVRVNELGLPEFKKSFRHRYVLRVLTNSTSYQEKIPKVLKDIIK